MQQQIHIAGITCDGCVRSIREQLLAVEGVSGVEVDPATGHGFVETEFPLSDERIRQALPAAYALLSADTLTMGETQASQEKPKWRRLLPLVVALTGIALIAAFMQWGMKAPRSFMLDFMGLFFLVFAGLKFLDYKNFPASFARYDPLARAWAAYGWAYPFIELLLAVLLLSRTGVTYALAFTVFILSLTTLGVLNALRKRHPIQCACMGTALNLPMTEATLIENLLMIGMAVATLNGLM